MFVFRWRTWLGIVLCLTSAPPLLAQEAQPSVLAIDTAASFDESVDFSGNYATGLSVDALVSVGLGRGLEGIVWPIVQRLGSGQWSRDVWIASVRYERAGPVGLRVEGGLVPSPVGLANFIGRRPHLNPTIAQPSSLFSAATRAARSPSSNVEFCHVRGCFSVLDATNFGRVFSDWASICSASDALGQWAANTS